MIWSWIAIALFVLLIGPLAVLLIWARRSGMTQVEATAYVRDLGIDLARLPGRLRRVAADPLTPRRARWWLIGLAIYVVSPIDPLPSKRRSVTNRLNAHVQTPERGQVLSSIAAKMALVKGRCQL